MILFKIIGSDHNGQYPLLNWYSNDSYSFVTPLDWYAVIFSADSSDPFKKHWQHDSLGDLTP